MRNGLPTVTARVILLVTMIVSVASVACSSGSTSGSSDSLLNAAEPAATRTTTPTPLPTEVPFYALLDVAPDFTLPSANSSPVTLSELSAEKPVVLVFYRAFW